MGALLLATCLSRLAGRMFALTIVLYALARTGSPIVAGWLAFTAVAPGLAISPLAGALIDRGGSVWAISVDMAASAASVAALVVVDRSGLASPPVLFGLTTLFSLTSPLGMAGIRALLARLAPRQALDHANALDTAIHGVTDIIGPALAGALTAFAGPELALATIANVYAAAALCIGRIGSPRGRLPHPTCLLFDAWSALIRVVGQPTLRGLAVSYSLYQICWGVLIVAVPVFVARGFASGIGAAIAGLLWAGLGLVGAISALTAGHLRTARRERRVMATGMLATALGAGLVAASLGLTGMVVALMLIGAAAGPVDVGALTLRQRQAGPAELGRVMSVSMSLNLAGGPIGSALAGALISWSLSATFAVAALAALAAAAAVGLIPRCDECD